MNLKHHAQDATVFIVDDDAAVCEAISNLLESKGMPSQCFGSSEEFLSNWNEEKAGCLVLDVRLPGMTGVEFQGRLAQSGVNIPIIFMTAHGDIPMVRKVMKAGAIEFLTKPLLSGTVERNRAGVRARPRTPRGSRLLIQCDPLCIVA